VQGKASTPIAFELGQETLVGQAFDEYLRPVANARITVGNQTTQSDAQGRFQLGPITSSTTILMRGEKAGHWTSHRRIMPTGRETHVQIMLRSQPFEHELSAERGGTISRGPFFLTLQPNGVLDANNQPYTGVVKIALNGGWPDDSNFGWMMPGGDFIAQEGMGRERFLFSFGFLSAQLQTPDGQLLQLKPSVGAELTYVIPPSMIKGAPETIPLWHFDEVVGIWKMEGFATRLEAAYVGTVRHLSSWNCDIPTERATVRGRVIDCKGRPMATSPIRVGQRTVTTDIEGMYRSFVPSGITFNVQSMSPNDRDTIQVGPLAAQSEVTLPDLAIRGSGMYGYAVIDTSNLLNIHCYGTRGTVEYSIDSGATYETSNTFTTHIDSNYQVLVKDSMDCPTRVNYFRLKRRGACQLLDSAELAQATWFGSVEEALSGNEPVHKLDFSSRNLWRFPEPVVFYFPCLQSLNLSETGHNILSESIGKLAYLQSLNLSMNGLYRLPESIGNLAYLQSLNLSGNGLDSLPEFIGNLTELQSLKLSWNRLDNLPESIGNLTQLEALELDTNALTTIPEFIINLTQLRRLGLANNQLTSLPESIGNLTQLRYLGLSNFSGKQLTSLPESIGNLSQLQELDLSNNQLRSLPESFVNLSQLQTLSFWENRLSSLPDSIGNLTNLRYLSLAHNQLTRLPDSIANLNKLRELSLRGNPIPPAEQERIRRLLPNCQVYF
jgi:Leucine-rich repeat (LRR) protein